MEDVTENSGAASQVCKGKEGTDAKTELHSEQKNVSPFCNECRSGDLEHFGIRVFTDRIGKTWYCKYAFTCEHAVISDGKIVSCRVRNAQIYEMGAR